MLSPEEHTHTHSYDLFVKTAKIYPEHVALRWLEDGDINSMIFSEVLNRVNRLSYILRKKYKIQGGDIISISLPRGPEYIFLALASWQLGAVYMPMPYLPEDGDKHMSLIEKMRFKFTTLSEALAEDSKTHKGKERISSDKDLRVDKKILLVTTELVAELIKNGTDDDINIRSVTWKKLELELTDKTYTDRVPHKVASIFSSSGTTGKPKLIEVPHEGIVDRIMSTVASFNEGYAEKWDDKFVDKQGVLCFAPYDFDASVMEFMMPLFTGGVAYIHPHDQMREPSEFCRRLDNDHEPIRVAILTPAVIKRMQFEDFPRLRALVTMGDDCKPQWIQEWADKILAYNGYGPTETTFGATLTRIRSGEDIYIKDPMRGIKLYFEYDGGEACYLFEFDKESKKFVSKYRFDQELDKYTQLEEIGVKSLVANNEGEVLIGGNGITRYLPASSEKNNEKFTSLVNADGSEERLYRTADYTRYNENRLKFLFRIDGIAKDATGKQILIRDIEDKLQDTFSSFIKEVKILLPANSGKVFYVFIEQERELEGEDKNNLFAFLGEKLTSPALCFRVTRGFKTGSRHKSDYGYAALREQGVVHIKRDPEAETGEVYEKDIFSPFYPILKESSQDAKKCVKDELGLTLEDDDLKHISQLNDEHNLVYNFNFDSLKITELAEHIWKLLEKVGGAPGYVRVFLHANAKIATIKQFVKLMQRKFLSRQEGENKLTGLIARSGIFDEDEKQALSLASTLFEMHDLKHVFDDCGDHPEVIDALAVNILNQIEETYKHSCFHIVIDSCDEREQAVLLRCAKILSDMHKMTKVIMLSEHSPATDKRINVVTLANKKLFLALHDKMHKEDLEKIVLRKIKRWQRQQSEFEQHDEPLLSKTIYLNQDDYDEDDANIIAPSVSAIRWIFGPVCSGKTTFMKERAASKYESSRIISIYMSLNGIHDKNCLIAALNEHLKLSPQEVDTLKRLSFQKTIHFYVDDYEFIDRNDFPDIWSEANFDTWGRVKLTIACRDWLIQGPKYIFRQWKFRPGNYDYFSEVKIVPEAINESAALEYIKWLCVHEQRRTGERPAKIISAFLNTLHILARGYMKMTLASSLYESVSKEPTGPIKPCISIAEPPYWWKYHADNILGLSEKMPPPWPQDLPYFSLATALMQPLSAEHRDHLIFEPEWEMLIKQCLETWLKADFELAEYWSSQLSFINEDDFITDPDKADETVCRKFDAIKKDEYPLFMFHPITGDCPSQYRELFEALDKQQTCYAFKMTSKRYDIEEFFNNSEFKPGEDDRSDTWSESIATKASFYVDKILEIQRVGPYHLLGWSFGSFLAFEVARQLQERGAMVRYVINIDGLHPGAVEKTITSMIMVLLDRYGVRIEQKIKFNEDLIAYQDDSGYTAMSDRDKIYETFEYAIRRLKDYMRDSSTQHNTLMSYCAALRKSAVNLIACYDYISHINDEAGQLLDAQVIAFKSTKYDVGLFRFGDFFDWSKYLTSKNLYREIELRGADHFNFAEARYARYIIDAISDYHKFTSDLPVIERLEQGLTASISRNVVENRMVNDVYVPLEATHYIGLADSHSPSHESRVDCETLLTDFLDKDTKTVCVLQGMTGAGKTTILWRIYKNLVETWNVNNRGFFPLFVEHDDEIGATIERTLRAMGVSHEEFTDYILSDESNQLILLVDEFDESLVESSIWNSTTLQSFLASKVKIITALTIPDHKINNRIVCKVCPPYLHSEQNVQLIALKELSIDRIRKLFDEFVRQNECEVDEISRNALINILLVFLGDIDSDVRQFIKTPLFLSIIFEEFVILHNIGDEFKALPGLVRHFKTYFKRKPINAIRRCSQDYGYRVEQDELLSDISRLDSRLDDERNNILLKLLQYEKLSLKMDTNKSRQKKITIKFMSERERFLSQRQLISNMIVNLAQTLQETSTEAFLSNSLLNSTLANSWHHLQSSTTDYSCLGVREYYLSTDRLERENRKISQKQNELRRDILNHFKYMNAYIQMRSDLNLDFLEQLSSLANYLKNTHYDTALFDKIFIHLNDRNLKSIFPDSIFCLQTGEVHVKAGAIFLKHACFEAYRLSELILTRYESMKCFFSKIGFIAKLPQATKYFIGITGRQGVDYSERIRLLFFLLGTVYNQKSNEVEIGNAISLLTLLSFPFAGLDLRGISVRSALLKNSLFHGSHLAHATFSSVRFESTYISHTVLDRTRFIDTVLPFDEEYLLNGGANGFVATSCGNVIIFYTDSKLICLDRSNMESTFYQLSQKKMSVDLAVTPSDELLACISWEGDDESEIKCTVSLYEIKFSIKDAVKLKMIQELKCSLEGVDSSSVKLVFTSPDSLHLTRNHSHFIDLSSEVFKLSVLETPRNVCYVPTRCVDTSVVLTYDLETINLEKQLLDDTTITLNKPFREIVADVIADLRRNALIAKTISLAVITHNPSECLMVRIFIETFVRDSPQVNYFRIYEPNWERSELDEVSTLVPIRSHVDVYNNQSSYFIILPGGRIISYEFSTRKWRIYDVLLSRDVKSFLVEGNKIFILSHNIFKQFYLSEHLVRDNLSLEEVNDFVFSYNNMTIHSRNSPDGIRLDSSGSLIHGNEIYLAIYGNTITVSKKSDNYEIDTLIPFGEIREGHLSVRQSLSSEGIEDEERSNIFIITKHKAEYKILYRPDVFSDFRPPSWIEQTVLLQLIREYTSHCGKSDLAELTREECLGLLPYLIAEQPVRLLMSKNEAVSLALFDGHILYLFHHTNSERISYKRYDLSELIGSHVAVSTITISESGVFIFFLCDGHDEIFVIPGFSSLLQSLENKVGRLSLSLQSPEQIHCPHGDDSILVAANNHEVAILIKSSDIGILKSTYYDMHDESFLQHLIDIETLIPSPRFDTASIDLQKSQYLKKSNILLFAVSHPHVMVAYSVSEKKVIQELYIGSTILSSVYNDERNLLLVNAGYICESQPYSHTSINFLWTGKSFVALRAVNPATTPWRSSFVATSGVSSISLNHIKQNLGTIDDDSIGVSSEITPKSATTIGKLCACKRRRLDNVASSDIDIFITLLLPEEVWLKIIGYLNIKETYTLLTTNREFYTLITQTHFNSDEPYNTEIASCLTSSYVEIVTNYILTILTNLLGKYQDINLIKTILSELGMHNDYLLSFADDEGRELNCYYLLPDNQEVLAVAMIPTKTLLAFGSRYSFFKDKVWSGEDESYYREEDNGFIPGDITG